MICNPIRLRLGSVSWWTARGSCSNPFPKSLHSVTSREIRKLSMQSCRCQRAKAASAPTPSSTQSWGFTVCAIFPHRYHWGSIHNRHMGVAAGARTAAFSHLDFWWGLDLWAKLFTWPNVTLISGPIFSNFLWEWAIAIYVVFRSQISAYTYGCICAHAHGHICMHAYIHITFHTYMYLYILAFTFAST